MQKFQTLSISLLLILMSFSACSFGETREEAESTGSNTINESKADQNDQTEEEMEEEEEETEKVSNSEPEAQVAGSIVDYSESELENSLSEGKNVVYFSADWCPTCVAFNEELAENPDDIPEGVTIVRADYDDETALKQEFGVTTQHTFVQLDENGEEIHQWTGGGLETLVSELK